MVEPVVGRLQAPFRWERERRHARAGGLTRLAATIAWHPVCPWRNRQHGPPELAAVLGW
jgi:hypothetical protein